MVVKKDPKKVVTKEAHEFKKFISQGNVLDMAVGVIIGGAFGKIVTSLVNDILMPFIGIVLGGLDFSRLSLKVNNATITYGAFIQSIVDFLIISFCIFIMIKFLANFKNKKTKEEEKAKKEEVLLLEEIRDLLKAEKQGKNN